MGDHSEISWTEATWNPTVGCMKVSAGCERCYAINTAYRLEHAFKQPPYAGLTRKLPDGSVNWTGEVRTLPERLALPLSWRKPRRIFVDSMSDLFHDDVPDEFLTLVFRTMLRAHWHTFQVLTKRPERMRQWVNNWRYALERWEMPPNIWLGVSVEDQRAADERIPLLLQTPAAVRWLSCEPLIGPVDIREWLPYYTACGASRDPETQTALDDLFKAALRKLRREGKGSGGISWVVAGGESGPNFRLLNLDWARSLRDQCQAAGVPFHFKQVGGRTHGAGGRLLDGRIWDEYPEPARELAHA